MQRKPISSSCINSIGYDSNLNILEIEFSSYEIYKYFDVPENIFREMMFVSSHGQFFHQYIKDSYRFE
jgi:hypothetical protein